MTTIRMQETAWPMMSVSWRWMWATGARGTLHFVSPELTLIFISHWVHNLSIRTLITFLSPSPFSSLFPSLFSLFCPPFPLPFSLLFSFSFFPFPLLFYPVLSHIPQKRICPADHTQGGRSRECGWRHRVRERTEEPLASLQVGIKVNTHSTF